MDCARTTVNIASYNYRGFNNLKVSFINKLFSFNQFVCLQEHWLRDSELSLFYSCMSIYSISFHACFGMADRELLIGRPYGGRGVAILWPSNVNFVVLPCPQLSKRCSAVKVIVNNSSFVLINVYFPNDNVSNNVVSEELRNAVDS